MNNTIVIEREITHSIILRYPYESTTDAMRLVKEFELIIVRQNFLEQCILHADVKRFFFDSFNSKVELLKATGHKISFSVVE